MTGVRPIRTVPPREAPIADDELPALFAMLSGRPLALAVSGGADSMALLHLVARWRAMVPEDAESAAQRLAAPPVVVLTVNHGLRAGSADEAAFVAAEAERRGFPCTPLRWGGEKPASGTQQAARDARRALFARALAEERTALATASGAVAGTSPRLVVMAHNLEDQAETVLMRLARGSGLDGLGGMHELSKVEVADSGGVAFFVARPFLAVSRQRLVATLRAHGVRWIEDPSNENTAFERVRIRKALGVLEELGLSAGSLVLSARRLRDAAEWMTYAERVCDGDEGARGGIAWNSGVVAELRFAAGPRLVRPRHGVVRDLRQALATCGGVERLPQLSQIERLAQDILASHPSPPQDVTLGGCRVTFARVRDGGFRIRIFREGAGLGSCGEACPPGARVSWDGGRYTIFADPDAPSGAMVRALGMAGWADLKRQLPVVAGLRWPAAAVATLPTVEIGGKAVAHPALDSAILGLPAEFAACQAAWREFYRGEGSPGGFDQARFFRAAFEVQGR